MNRLFLFLPLLAITLILGCEDNNTDDSFNDMPDITSLKIIPSSVVISPTNSYTTFLVQGGIPPYSWRVSDSTLGAVADSTAHLVTYTRTESAFGVNVISVQDKNGWQLSAQIWQPADTNSAHALSGH